MEDRPIAFLSHQTACRDILCVDKTGTLTDDEVVLVKSLDAEFQPSLECLKLGYANSLFQVGLSCQSFMPESCCRAADHIKRGSSMCCDKRLM